MKSSEKKPLSKTETNSKQNKWPAKKKKENKEKNLQVKLKIDKVRTTKIETNIREKPKEKKVICHFQQEIRLAKIIIWSNMPFCS